MARKEEEKVSLNKRRFMKAIRQAGYVYLDPHGRDAITFNKFKEEIQEHYAGQSAGVSEVKIKAAKRGDPITLRSAQSIADFLKVDLDYLTGDQLRPTLEETEQELERRSDLEEQLRIRAVIAFASKHDWHIVPDDQKQISAFTIYDPEDQLICEHREIKDLYPFIEAAEHLMQLEADLVYQFLGSLQQKKDLQQ